MTASNCRDLVRALGPYLVAVALLSCSSGATLTEEPRSATDTAHGDAGDRDLAISVDGDSDGDGIPNGEDHCRDEPEDLDGFEDDDGCPDPDNDGDFIPDVDDVCSRQPELLNGFDDEDGCPDHVLINVPVALPAVAFDANQPHADIVEAQFAMFEDLIANTLNAAPESRFAVIGDTARPDISEKLRCIRARFLLDEMVARGYDRALFELRRGGLAEQHAIVVPISEAALRETRPCEETDGE